MAEGLDEYTLNQGWNKKTKSGEDSIYLSPPNHHKVL